MHPGTGNTGVSSAAKAIVHARKALKSTKGSKSFFDLADFEKVVRKALGWEGMEEIMEEALAEACTELNKKPVCCELDGGTQLVLDFGKVFSSAEYDFQDGFDTALGKHLRGATFDVNVKSRGKETRIAFAVLLDTLGFQLRTFGVKTELEFKVYEKINTLGKADRYSASAVLWLGNRPGGCQKKTSAAISEGIRGFVQEIASRRGDANRCIIKRLVLS
jgi:hypothetical protein